MYNEMPKLSSITSYDVVLLDSNGNLHCLMNGVFTIHKLYTHSGSSYIIYNLIKYEIDADTLDIRMLIE